MADRKKMHVNVVATDNPQSQNGVDFRLENDKGEQLETLVFSKTKLGMHKNDEHEVRFKLIQDSGMKLQFAQQPHVALWVAQGDEHNFPACPTSQPACPDLIFYAEKSNVNTLVAVNTNPNKLFFKFSLNFVDPTSAQPNRLICYDPGGENQNGGIDNLYAYYAIGGALLGAAISAVTTTTLIAQNLLIGAVVGAGLGFLLAKLLEGRSSKATGE